MTYDIIATGSGGNAVFLDCGILIDCGVPFQKLCHVASKIKLILLTHEHGDHLKPSTLKRLLREYPKIKVACGAFLLTKLKDICPLKKIRVLPINALVSWGKSGIQTRTFPLYHDVENIGYLVFSQGKSLCYATDTVSMGHNHIPNCDYYLIEGNFKEAEIREKMIEKMKNGQYIYEHRVLKTHLSEEKAMAWLVSVMGAHSRFELIHQHQE